jgi:hypothetical protein
MLAGVAHARIAVSAVAREVEHVALHQVRIDVDLHDRRL